jgi:hypothetical protein
MDGNYFFAYTKRDKKRMMGALSAVFGKENGFKFEGNKLVYSGSLILKDKQKEYLLNLILEKIVNNANNNVHLFKSGHVVKNHTYFFSDDDAELQEAKALGYKTKSVDGESTITINEGEHKSTTTIFVSHATSTGEGYPETIRDINMLIWHGIGHSITNNEYNIDFLKVNPNRNLANKQTIGFENLIAGFLKLKLNSGSAHGQENDLNSRGVDNKYPEEAQNYGQPNDPMWDKNGPTEEGKNSENENENEEFHTK